MLKKIQAGNAPIFPLMQAMFSFPDLPLWAILLSAICTIIAGFTKGVTGFALPMVMISSMASFLDPKLAIASMVLPTLLTNLFQALRTGWRDAWATLVKYRILIGTTLIMVFVHAQWIGSLNFTLLFAILGAAIALLSFVQIIGVTLTIPPRMVKISAFITGQIAGFFGSISGSWGPPTVIYLMSINTPKAEQVRVSGISFGLGAVVFWLAHQSTGLINSQSLMFSLYLCFPALFGLWLGGLAQDKIDQRLFRRAVLWVLLIAGLNILRRALMG